jgi:hypothetical protein
MKTLLLQDEVYERLLETLGESEAGKDLIRTFRRKPRLPPDRELVSVSRDGGDPPEAVTRARDYRDAGRQTAIETRETMEDMLRHCYGAGVRPVVLSRWFGLKPTRVYEIIGPGAD